SRLGYLSQNEEEFFQRLDRLMAIAKNSLEIKRKLVKRNMEEGLLPYTKRYLDTLDNHFSTIGLIGMNEACLNLLGKNIATTEGKKLALQVLDFMRNRIQDFQEETGNIYNLEATPAEGASYRLAKLDKEKFPDIIAAGEEIPYYTNSTLLPVGNTDDVFEALEHQEELQAKYTGGTVFHVLLGERMPGGEACKNLIRRIISNFRIPYITITPTFSICRTHGYLKGEQPECPLCHQPTEVYSRVVGYYRPVVNWNLGKKEEFKERVAYEVDKLTAPLKRIPAAEIEPQDKAGLVQSCKFFFSERCPHCSLVKAYVEKLDLPGETIDAGTPEGLEEARKYDVRSTPTVLFFDSQDNLVETASSLSEIKDVYKRLTENLSPRLSRKDSLDLVLGKV
ncbi:MAG: ribonucleoside triphosphate reductase, partial [Candidatus Latescibacteria bacterium]|nr:ribonucleoside triphosphate reductase [Candidatus Latescibacterota bacterium]